MRIPEKGFSFSIYADPDLALKKMPATLPEIMFPLKNLLMKLRSIGILLTEWKWVFKNTYT
jgi:hypothetical protein